MHYKKFTSESEIVHKKFICREFFLDFKDMGIDFMVGSTGIELKCKKRYRKTVTFVCNVNQIVAWESLLGVDNLLWMFMLYDLSCDVSSIRGRASIERSVCNREFWVLPWDFIKQHTIHDYPSWGPHYHFTTKDFPRDIEIKVISGVVYHVSCDPKAQELFSRREFLLP